MSFRLAEVSSLLRLGLIFAVAGVAQDTTGAGSLQGTLKLSGGTPAASAKVCVQGTNRCATSTSDGSFRLTEIRAGEVALEISLPGEAGPRKVTATVRAGLESNIEFELPKIDAVSDSVTVSESVFIAPEEIKNSGFLVQRQEISKSAGVLQDVARYVQTLPGVVIGSNDFRNDIIVRGGSPLENLFVVDNIEIPNINAFANFASAGGTVSILDAELIEDVTFLSGGYPAPYINRASSVLQVAQREGSRDGFRGRATVGFAGGGGILEGPIRKGKGSWIVSARRSFLDFFTDDVGFGGVPVLYTFNAKAVYDLTPRDRIWGVTVSGVDNIRLGATQKERTEDAELNNLDIRYDGWRAASGFNWQRLMGERAVGLLGVTHSEAKVGSQVRDLARNAPRDFNVPVDSAIAAAPLVYRDNSREGETTVKYDFTGYLPMFDKVQAGGSHKIFRVNYDTASPFGQNSPFSPVNDINAFFLKRDFLAHQTGAYVQNTRNLGRRWNLTWGGRLDRYQFIGRTRFSPRAGLSYRITDRLSWRLSYGQYFQQPLFLFLSAFPQNQGLTAFRAEHWVTGFSYVASPTLRFTVEAYNKVYKDYPVSSQFPQLSLANVGDTFAVREIIFPLTSAGRGRARGLEFFVEKKFTNKWFGQANFAVMRSRQAGTDGIQRPSTYDYPRVANLVGGYRLNPKWEFSLRSVYLAGRPYTPFNEALSRQLRRGAFDLAQVNALRLPAYARVDVRVDRTFTVRDKPFIVFAGAQNITNRKNVGGLGWNRNSNRAEFGEQLGLFPLVGIDWRF
jgi:outer membrane receptor protein involved in Fe transport